MSDWGDLDVLDRFLMSEAAPENSMGLSDLDGFLTGILAGPDLIMPSEWLPRVWGGEAPDFESTAQAQEILGAIMGRYNQIAQNLDGDPGDLNPIYWENAGGITIAADWAEGFLSAVELRPDAWTSLLHDTDAGILALPILALCSDEDGNDLIDLDDMTKTEMFGQAPDIIPTCVFGIRNFWRTRESQSWPIRNPPKVGRNEPCPCGSGRKYKKCCGAN